MKKEREEKPVKDVFIVFWLLLIMPGPSEEREGLRTAPLGECKVVGLSIGSHPTWVKSGPISVDILVLLGYTHQSQQTPAHVPSSSVLSRESYLV